MLEEINNVIIYIYIYIYIYYSESLELKFLYELHVKDRENEGICMHFTGQYLKTRF